MGSTVTTSPPLDNLGWRTINSDAETAGNTYTPSIAVTSNAVSLDCAGFSYARIRAVYATTVATTGIAVLWGKKTDGTWTMLYDTASTPTQLINLNTTTGSNMLESSVYYGSNNQNINLVGCEKITCTIQTASISALGAVSVQACVF
jgi:hypothetical protein